MIRVLFFGPVAARVQASELPIAYNVGLTIQDVIDSVTAQHPHAFEIVSFIAINGEQVRDRQTLLADNNEVVFMAKFSGG